ncbi:hypothetical protein RCL1_008537 [Eukaryota sp. TZLM3-RCL]
MQSFSAKTSNLLKNWSKNMERGALCPTVSITDERITRCHPRCESKEEVEEVIRKITSFVEKDQGVQHQSIKLILLTVSIMLLKMQNTVQGS